MRLNYCASLAFAAVCVSLLAISCWAAGEHHVDLHHNEQVAEPEKLQPVPARQRFQLPKIFDFELYKRLFKKAYHGIEESVRRKLMLARAFRAWISSLKYKYRKSSFYLSINHLSDKSPEELERMENHHLNDYVTDAENIIEAHPASRPSIPDVDPNTIEEDLEKLTGGDSEDVERLRELQDELRKQQAASRRKRDAASVETVKPRDFDMNKLMNLEGEATLDPETAKKVDLHPSSNNPDYEAPELISYGWRDEQYDKVNWWKVNLPRRQPQETLKSVASDMSFLRNSRAPTPSKPKVKETRRNEPELRDEVFFDHRDSKCMFLPRSQGDCGSCWAFTAITLAEWLYCKQTGKLVAFSEQYLIDCAKLNELGNGCRGGHHHGAAIFIHNYGLELRVNYPYRAREDVCPYDGDTDPKSMGYVRMDFKHGLKVPVDSMGNYLHMGPMFIIVSTKNGFHEYGGGVMDGAGCYGMGTHAMVLIGHGREDGREYWLIRNSHSVGWGEQGHYKLAKDSDCIQPSFGYLYGTKDGKSYTVRPDTNQNNDAKAIKKHYAKNLALGLDLAQ